MEINRRRFLPLASTLLVGLSCGDFLGYSKSLKNENVTVEGIFQPIPQEFSSLQLVELVPQEILPRLIPSYDSLRNNLGSFSFDFISNDSWFYVDGSGRRANGKWLGVTVWLDLSNENKKRKYHFEFLPKPKYTIGVRSAFDEMHNLKDHMSEILVANLNSTAQVKGKIDVRYSYFS